jgi:hypothetical protein
MSKGNTFENDLLGLIFQAKTIANLAVNATSSPLTVLWCSLHTADPGEAGLQNTTEATYGPYARVSVARTSAGWTITANSVSPVANISFPACTSGTSTVTFAAVGTASTGTGKVLWKGAVSPSISVSAGVTPRLTTLSTVTED